MRLRKVLFDVDVDGSNGGGGTPPSGAPSQNNPGNSPGSGNQGAPTGKDGASQYLESKVDDLHKDLSKTRAENRALKQQLEQATAKVTTFELAEKKSTLFREAREKLGADFEIPGDKLDSVQKIVQSLPDGDDLGERISGVIDLIKQPKAAEQKPPFSSFSGGQPTGGAAAPASRTFAQGERLTPAEVAALPPADQQAYLRSLQQRR